MKKGRKPSRGKQRSAVKDLAATRAGAKGGVAMGDGSVRFLTAGPVRLTDVTDGTSNTLKGS